MRLLALSVLIVLLPMALSGCSLPRRSEQSIRKHFLDATPQGTTYSRVLVYVKNQGWPLTERSGGYEKKRFGNTPSIVIGKLVIKADIGSYRGLPWRKDVEVFWAFDERNELIDVFVEKQADAP